MKGSGISISRDDDSLNETLYLLRSPENARRLLHALQLARADDVVERELTDL